MTSREKVLNALNHKSGPIPVDFGATPVTGIHVSCVAALRAGYGLEKRPVKVHEPYQMLGLLDEDLLAAVGADVIGMEPLSTMFGFPVKDWKEWRTPWGQEVLVPGQFNVSQNEQGVYIYPQGDTSAAPSGRMPRGGYFFDSLIRQQKLDEDNLNPDDNLEEFILLTDEQLKQLKTNGETGWRV